MWPYIVFGLLILYLVYIFAAASKITEIASKPIGNTYDQEIEVLKGFGYDCNKFLKSVETENFQCKSKFGYEINGRVFRLDNSERAVLLCHGYGGNSTTMLSYANIFRKLGFSVVVYDHRNFGINEKCFTSFGLYESEDLKTVFSYVKKLFPKTTEWGIMGESMGAATMLMALPDIRGLKFAIDDCGYSDMKSEIKIKNPLPSLGSVGLCDLFLKKRYGYTMKQVRPVDSVKNISKNLPMLFIYSKTDRIVPFNMFGEIYSNKKGPKESWVVDDCRHAKTIFKYTKEYEDHVSAFLSKHGL